MSLAPLDALGKKKKKKKKTFYQVGSLQKAALCGRLLPSAAPHKAALCTTHGAGSESWSPGDRRWETPCHGSLSCGGRGLPPDPPALKALLPPFFSSKTRRTACPHQTILAVLCLRDHVLSLFRHCHANASGAGVGGRGDIQCLA